MSPLCTSRTSGRLWLTAAVIAALCTGDARGHEAALRADSSTAAADSRASCRPPYRMLSGSCRGAPTSTSALGVDREPPIRLDPSHSTSGPSFTKRCTRRRSDPPRRLDIDEPGAGAVPGVPLVSISDDQRSPLAGSACTGPGPSQGLASPFPAARRAPGDHLASLEHHPRRAPSARRRPTHLARSRSLPRSTLDIDSTSVIERAGHDFTFGGDASREACFPRPRRPPFPDDCPSPFWLVIIDSMATGTPSSPPSRSVPESSPTASGFSRRRVGMVDAVSRLDELDPTVPAAGRPFDPRDVQRLRAIYETLTQIGAARPVRPR